MAGHCDSHCIPATGEARQGCHKMESSVSYTAQSQHGMHSKRFLKGGGRREMAQVVICCAVVRTGVDIPAPT